MRIDDKDISDGLVGKTLEKINFWNTARTFKSFFVNAATAARTYTFPDKDGTVAMLDDVGGGGAIEYVGVSQYSGITLNMTVPTGVLNGDLMLLFFQGGSATTVSNLDSSWKLIKTQAPAFMIYAKMAEFEINNVTGNLSSGCKVSLVCLRNCKVIEPLGDRAYAYSATITTNTLTPIAAGATFCLSGIDSGVVTYTPPSGFLELFDAMGMSLAMKQNSTLSPISADTVASSLEWVSAFLFHIQHT